MGKAPHGTTPPPARTTGGTRTGEETLAQQQAREQLYALHQRVVRAAYWLLASMYKLALNPLPWRITSGTHKWRTVTSPRIGHCPIHTTTQEPVPSRQQEAVANAD